MKPKRMNRMKLKDGRREKDQPRHFMEQHVVEKGKEGKFSVAKTHNGKNADIATH
jgi:hypothetical protein